MSGDSVSLKKGHHDCAQKIKLLKVKKVSYKVKYTYENMSSNELKWTASVYCNLKNVSRMGVINWRKKSKRAQSRTPVGFTPKMWSKKYYVTL